MRNRFPTSIVFHLSGKSHVRIVTTLVTVCGMLLAATELRGGAAGYQRRGDSEEPVLVQPGAPGSPTKRLPTSAKGMLTPLSSADELFEFATDANNTQRAEIKVMQGMLGKIPVKEKP
jgi:hypothetical protein